jgi:hypothetical protein
MPMARGVNWQPGKKGVEMKKLLFVISILCVLVIAASELPPALPSSFYGQAPGLKAGTVINVSIGNQVVAKTKIFSYLGYGVVYLVDVPMDDVAEGTIATFKIGKNIYGTASLHSGTNVQLNLSLITGKHK